MLIFRIFSLFVSHLFLLAPFRSSWSLSDADFDYLFDPQPCPEHCHTSPEHQLTRDNNNGAFSIFYLILIHNRRTANDAIHLFRAIRDPRNTIAIHYDAKMKDQNRDDNNTQFGFLQHEIDTCPCGATVVTDSVHTVEWSRWSMNLPLLWGMELAATETYNGNWDVFVNLSGDTLPVYAVDAMATRLQGLSNYNFVTSRSCETGLVPTPVYDFPRFWHKRRHYTLDETEPDPVFEYVDEQGTLQSITITTHFGSQWVVLQPDFVHWVVDQLNDSQSWVSQFRDYLKQSGKLMTDETFVSTVAVYYKNGSTLPSKELVLSDGATTMTDIRFERMDEHFPSSNGVFPELQRYRVPDKFVSETILEQPRSWGPYFLGVYDLSAIRESGALFARKISALVDPNLVRLLPVTSPEQIPNIHWPYLVEISDKPDWEEEKKMWIESTTQRDTVADEADNEDTEEL
jgi:Core-2/I-Branching enzyme